MPDLSADELASLAIKLNNVLYAVCFLKDVQIEVSPERALEVVTHFGKDLLKLKYHQGEAIALNKRIAGLAFWIRRVKPIAYAAKVNDNREIIDINEQAAVWLMHELLLAYADSDHVPESMRALPVTQRAPHLEQFLAQYWRLDDYFNYTSLIYNLRYRNISPHHMTLLLDAIMSGFTLRHAA